VSNADRARARTNRRSLGGPTRLWSIPNEGRSDDASGDLARAGDGSVRHHPPRAALVALLFCLLAPACGTPSSGRARLAAQPEGWREVVAESTRRVEPYHWTFRAADLRATLFTPRARAAFIAEREKFHGRFTRDVAAELVALGAAPDEGVDAPMKAKPDGEEQVLVLASLYVSDQKNRELQIRQTIWDTELVRGSARVKPLAIEPIRITPAVTALFPFVDRFDEVYLLRFPLVDAASGQPLLSAGGPPLRLEVRSAIADCVLEWTLEE